MTESDLDARTLREVPLMNLERLDTRALADAFAGEAEAMQRAVLRIGNAGSSSEMAELRGAVARVFGIGDRLVDVRAREASRERPAALEIEMKISDSAFRFDVLEARDLERGCFRSARLAAWYSGATPGHATAELHRMADCLARVDQHDNVHPDVSLLIDWMRGERRLCSSTEPISASELWGSEGVSVRRMLREYTRWFGSPPLLLRRVEEGQELHCLHFPEQHLADESFFEIPARITADPTSAAYLRRLGFDWVKSGAVRTVPFPASYRRALSRLGIADAGLSPRLLALSAMWMFDRRWLIDQCDGVLPINLASPAYYALRRPLRIAPLKALPRVQRDWHAHFATLPHDLSTHLLPSQLVPRRLFVILGRQVRAHLAMLGIVERVVPPRALLVFYDTDLFLHCRELWRSVRGLDELPPAFLAAESLRELFGRLRRRIAEMRAG